ncbi:uncharacterized protein cd34 [Pempheris klunzingeri]|uniref:uncharacterized protein cd34 n=1 Tax=Pempheris klunzingeri TaxID=3127111 RepID=UPI00397F8798
MPAPMWRMNGLLRRMAGLLVLCALLLSNEVMCQDDPSTDATDAPVTDPAADASAAPDATPEAAVASASTVAAGDASAASAAPEDNSFVTIIDPALDADQAGDTSGTSGTTVAPIIKEEANALAPEVPDVSPTVKAVVPDVKCVGKDVIPESTAVKAEVTTADCEETKRIIQENPAAWCSNEKCNLEIYQDGNTVQMASNDAKLSTLVEALQSDALKDKLGVTKAETPSSSNSSVFVGILVTGLLAALAITVGYFKCQRIAKTDTKGVRLAEEAYPVDQENQGNTLVSVAPLNPPPETQEKPSVNGESPEAAKTQPPPPTNGHSTTKTADTEL